MATRKGLIPLPPVQELLRGYLERSGESAIQLSKRAGLRSDMVHSLLRAEHNAVHFTTVDKLVCAMGCVDDWFVGPLAAHYRKGA